MDAPLIAPDALIRPWRTATLVTGLFAALELVALIAIGFVVLAKPLSHAIRAHAVATALAPAKRPAAAVRRLASIELPRLTREQTGVLVLNGNGRTGAAHAEASKLQALGYRVPAAGDAKRSDYATTVVMFRRGYHAEANRLAHDLGVKIVGPLDGLTPSSLHGGQLAIVLGAQ